MRLNSIPEQYEALYRGAFYEIEANTQEVIEVRTKPVGTSLGGLKRLSGQNSYRVNISPFLHDAITFEPDTTSATQLSVLNSRLINYSTEISYYFQNQYIDTITDNSFATIGSRKIEYGKIMSDAPLRRKITPTGSDEICFIVNNMSVSAKISIETTANETIKHELLPITNALGYVCLNISANDILKKVSLPSKAIKFVVEVRIGGNDPILVDYNVIPTTKDTLCLKWINPYGAIDSYYFDHKASNAKVQNKRRLLNTNGYQVVVGGLEHTITVASDFETADTINWLSEVISAPKVWNMVERAPSRIEVLTDDVVSQRGELCRMELKLKPLISTTMQII